MKTLKVLLSGIVFLALCLPLLGIKESKKPGFAKINHQFVKFTKKIETLTPIITAEGRQLRPIIPYPVDLSHTSRVYHPAARIKYPKFYDLRNHQKLTPVRNQSSCGSCWTFGTMASLESCLLPGEVRNFSEEHLNLHHGFDYDSCMGGNIYISTAYFARWDGPLDEIQFPYPLYSEHFETYRNFFQKHIQNVIFLPNRCGPDVVLEGNPGLIEGYEPVPREPLDNDIVKWFIMNRGVVTAGVGWEGSFYHSGYRSFYNDIEGGDINHAVAIIGWDDDYSPDKFAITPPGKGAYIMRNSWGNDWGEQGYFYISYYDESLTTDASFYTTESETNYSSIYQYDPFGATASFGGEGTTYWGANIFRAENNRPLAAVSFYLNDVNANYEIFIYKNVPGENPVKGSLAGSKAGSKIYAGYYTIKLDQEVLLSKNERFSVVIKFTNTTYQYPVPVESPVEDYSSGAESSAGESFISPDGLSWEDMHQYCEASNVCIKAFTAMKPQSLIDLQTTQKTEHAWFISKSYSQIEINVSNQSEVPISRLDIYRMKASGRYEKISEITASTLIAGKHSFIGEFIEANTTYSYQVVAYDSSGDFCGLSNHSIVH